MKRSPLQRRTPLARGTGFGSSSEGTKPVAARRRMRQVSAKRAAENDQRRDALLVVRARCRGWCETCPILSAGGVRLDVERDHQGSDGHEPLTRARGGSITDPANILWACRWSHDWIHRHPAAAAALGLLIAGGA